MLGHIPQSLTFHCEGGQMTLAVLQYLTEDHLATESEAPAMPP